MGNKKLTRIILLSDGKVAIVELPMEGYARKLGKACFNRQDEK